MFTKPQPKARLERADPRESILQNDIIIRISLTTALILAMILFLAIFMALRLKNRAKEPNLKKVLIYGMDGSGKSTFAEQYCNEHGLNPICIDIDDTNYTNVPIVEINLTTDLTTYNSIKETIKEITKSEYDTIILDGVTSLLEMLTSKAKGMAAYSDRSKRWNDILRNLVSSKKNLIFIGQIDMRLVFNDDSQSSKAVIKVNSMQSQFNG